MSELTTDSVYDALRAVIDPEIGLDIVTLGLVYDVAIYEGGRVDVVFTLTTRGCPMERAIRGGIEHAVAQLAGVTEVVPHIVWEPRWSPTMVAEGAL